MADPLLFDLAMAPPGRMTMPRILGGATEGGTSLSGIAIASSVAGDGLVAVDYANLQIRNDDPSRLRFMNRLALALAGGVRKIVVPLLTDFIAPIPLSVLTSTARFADGSTFNDGSGFSVAPVTGVVTAAGRAGAGVISVSVIGGTGVLEGGEWFGLAHAIRGPRCYGVTDILAQSDDGAGNAVYQVAIRPTLRDDIPLGADVDWYRPKCLMRLTASAPPDIDVEKFWLANPTLKFIEAF